MKLLAIAAENHDANISYWDGQTLHYYKAERAYQIKHAHFKTHYEWRRDIQSLWGIDYQDVDQIVFNMVTDRHLEIEDPTVVLNNSADLPFEQVVGPDKNWFVPGKNVWFLNHHYCHSLSTWVLSDREPDVSIVIDGVGDGYSWSVFRDHKLVDRWSIKQGSVGHQMDRIAKLVGIQSASYLDYSGKLMGLQSYGQVDQGFLELLKPLTMSDVNRIFDETQWVRYKGSDLLAQHTLLDWAATVHYHMAQVLVDFFKKYVAPDEVVSYTGGVAQNVVWNSELKKHFPNLIIAPHCADDGISLGAIEWLRQRNGLDPFTLDGYPYAQSDHAPTSIADTNTVKQAADMLAQGLTLGWYQGHGEIGPRALGHRSILMDPRLANGREKINRIKKREQYRPFGARILADRVGDYFPKDHRDPYMLSIAPVNTPTLPAITHIDGTCRVQTLEASDDVFYKLLSEFEKFTGCPILLNTSMNLAGKPMASHPDLARELFYTSELDVMVIGNEILRKLQ